MGQQGRRMGRQGRQAALCLGLCHRGAARLCRGACGLYGIARQIVRPARLRPGARKPLAAEGLAAHHGADLVAVDIDIADMQRLDDALHPVVDPGMQAEGQAIAGGIDRRDHRVDLRGLEGDDMQDGAEDLALHLRDAAHPDHRRRNEGAGGRGGQFLHHPPFCPGSIDIGADRPLRLGINHRADIGVQMPGVAQRQLIHRARQHLQQVIGDVFLHIEAAQSRAALPRALEAGRQNVAHRLFRQGSAVHQHGIQPAGFRDQRCCRVQMIGHGLADLQRGLRRSGEGHAVHPGIAGQHGAHSPVARQQLQRCRRHARPVQQIDRESGDQRCLFGGLRQHGIACRQCGRNLAGEDRQREVPRADADKHPTRRRGLCCALIGVIAQKIHRLAQFGHGIRQALARLARQQGEDRAEFGLVQIGGAAQDFGTLCRGGIPGLRRRQRGFHIRRGGGQQIAHPLARGRVAHIQPLPPGHRSGQTGAGIEQHGFMRRPRGLDCCQIGGIGQIETFGIAPFPEQLCRCQDGRVRDAGHLLHVIERAGCHGFGRHILIHDLVHERRIGAVFQQAAHQIGQQIAMCPDRRIDAAARPLIGQHQIMQPFAHAMQALKLELAQADTGRLRQIQNRRHGMRIMARELRIDAVGHAQQFLRIGDIADIGGLLAGEHRETVQPQHLRALHLGIPIGALHQPHHDLAIQPGGQRIKPVQHSARAASIGLHHHAEAIPAFQRAVGKHRLDHLQRQGKAVGLFGVDVEAQPGSLGKASQRADAGHQLFHHAVAFGHLVARMQRRKFHRNAGVAADVALGGSCGNRGDRLGIAQVIAPRVGFGTGGLAQHVIAVGVTLGLQLFGALHRALDGFAQHELAAHLFHRARNGGADHGFPQTLHHAAQQAHHAGFAVLQHLAGQHQGPGRGIHQAGGRMAQMAAPVGRRDLVFDQRIHGFGIRHPQQRLGQTHQRDALVGRQSVFGQKNLHQPGLYRCPDAAHQIGTRRGDPGAGGGIKARFRNQGAHQICLAAQALGFDHGPVVLHVAGHLRLS